MRLNNKSIIGLNVHRTPLAGANLLGTSLERLSSGYRISASDDSVVRISPHMRAESNGLPQLIRSSGARRAG